jgi:site-specific DNA-methyltransferase (adenine-specific)
VWRGVAVWDKGEGARPIPGFRAQAEYVVWGTRGPAELDGVYLPGVLRYPTVRAEKEWHSTAKPVALMEKLLEVVPAGGIVLDPFAGSGTTGLAATRTGRRAVLVEVDAVHERNAVDRLAQRSLFAAADDAEPAGSLSA